MVVAIESLSDLAILMYCMVSTVCFFRWRGRFWNRNTCAGLRFSDSQSHERVVHFKLNSTS